MHSLERFENGAIRRRGNAVFPQLALWMRAAEKVELPTGRVLNTCGELLEEAGCARTELLMVKVL